MFHAPAPPGRLAGGRCSWEPGAVPGSPVLVLAHQGGWDEALFVIVPMIVLVGLLALAQRRAAAEHEAEHGTGQTPVTGEAAAAERDE